MDGYKAVTLASLLAVALGGTPSKGASLAETNAEAALLIRAAFLEKSSLDPLRLELMPVGLVSVEDRGSSEYRLLWSNFFSAALAHTAGSGTDSPTHFFYSPLAHVILLTHWTGMPASPVLVDVCAMPAEVALGTEYAAGGPPWSSKSDALASLVEDGEIALSAIKSRYPAALSSSIDLRSLCSSEHQLVAELRLASLTAAADAANARLPLRGVLSLLNGNATEPSLAMAWPRVPELDRQRVLAMGRHAADLSVVGAVTTSDKGYVLFLAHATTARTYAVVLSRERQMVQPVRFLDIDVRRG